MTYLGNAFSLQMVSAPATFIVERVESTDIPTDAVSCIGHPDTAAVLSDMLGFPVPTNRQSISLTDEDILYVAQVVGGRLPEGSTTLPEGFRFDFLKVTAQKPKENCLSDLCRKYMDKHGICDECCPMYDVEDCGTYFAEKKND